MDDNKKTIGSIGWMKHGVFFVKNVMIMSEELYNELQRAYTKVPLSSMIRADIEPYWDEK